MPSPCVRHGSSDGPQGHNVLPAAASERSRAIAVSPARTPLINKTLVINSLIFIIFYPFGYFFTRYALVAQRPPWGVEWPSYASLGRH